MGELDPVTRSWFREYQFLQVVPMTHGEYLDADPEFVDMMLGIDQVFAKKQADQARQERKRC